MIALVLVALGFAAATARASSTTSSSGAATCSSMPGSCNFSGNGSAAFAGQFDTPAVLIDQSLCAPQAGDPTDTLCGHFGIDTSNVQGSVTVTIAFNPDNDLDLCVVNMLAQNAAPCSTGTGDTEIVTFSVACTDTHFEAQILPISFPFPGPTPVAPAAYTGSVAASLTDCGTGNGTGGGTPPPVNGEREVEGGGQLASVTVDTNFSVKVEQEDGKLKGKVRVSSSGCDFRSKAIDSVEWDDLNRTATIHGRGTMKGSDALVPFNAVAHDGGGDRRDNTGDMFTIDKCSSSSIVAKGHIEYEIETEHR